MLDIKLIREDPERVKSGMKRLGAVEAPIDRILELDHKRRELLQQVEEIKARRNAVSKEIGKLKGAPEAAGLIEEMRTAGDRIKALDQEVYIVEDQLGKLMLTVPNLPHPLTPDGVDESDNPVLREWGQKPEFDFEPRPHWELGEELGIIDFERGVKLSGSRFYVLKGAGARLQRALIAWMLDLHVNEHGYTEIYPPFVVKGECLEGTGNLPKFAENLYRDFEDDLWLIPTAEVPITNLYRDEIIDGGKLPISHVGYTPCFRREKMSAGRDVRGIKRGHQFDKVEMVKFAHPDNSVEELEKLLDDAEDVARKLGIPYRIVQMCAGDLSFVAALKYDIEVWAPGCDEWLEVSSCSLFTDFQARRARIRFRGGPNEKPRFVHTINGSGLALPRLMIAVLETCQRRDGSVVVPEVLRPYMGGVELIEAEAGQ